MRIVYSGILLLSLLNISNSQNMQNIEKTTLGSGCFWCTEAIFERVKGVVDVKSGYSGGHVKKPSYREVCDGTTGHAEVVQVTFNPKEISYASILEIFFSTHDPTQLNQQGNDVGTQYRSVIFYHSEEQKITAGRIKKELSEANIWDKPIVTEIQEYSSFYVAEDYHDDYYKRNPDQGYCRYVITPKVEKFEEVFKKFLKVP